MIFDPLTILTSDYKNGWGRDTCNPRLKFSQEKVTLFSQGISLGLNNLSTDVEVRNSIAYLAADGISAASPDFFIVDLENPETPVIMSSLNTGPGISALEVAGHYVYTANLSTTNQLQIIDISNRSAPALLTKYKLPLPQASSSPPRATSIFYSKGLIYLGTEKWEGNEFSIIDVTVPALPRYVGGFKTNTLVNAIYVRDGFAYVATSDSGQMRVLDIYNPTNIILVATFSPSGWETQEGKSLSYFEGNLSLGRTTGGFNQVKNHELFTFSTSSISTSPFIQVSRDIPGGVYGVISRPPFVYLATHSKSYEFQIMDVSLATLIFEKSLSFSPTGMVCDNDTLYFATGDDKGIATLKIN